MAGTTKTRTKPDRTFWQRLAGGLRRLLPPAWRGEAIGDPTDPGYYVNPYDLFDGLKGVQPGLYGLLAAWRRSCGGGAKQQRPPGQAYSDAYVRDLTRMLQRHNPFAQAMLSALQSYVLADQGMSVEVHYRQGLAAGPGQESLVRHAQAYLDDFMDRDDWWSRERELYVRCHRDGEAILRYFAGRGGVRLRFVEPECMVAPDATPEWTDGVRTAADDAETLEAIWVQTGMTPSDGEELDADEVYFIRCNADRCL